MNKHKNLIIHFTSTFKNLKNILSTSSLRLSYCKEDFLVGKRRVSSAAHPMVCFSEQNIIDLQKKRFTYGCYGLGFSKSWARKRKVSPVMYIPDNSQAAKGLGTLLVARRNNENNRLPKELKLAIMQLKCFTKNETGNNRHLKINNFDFKNENEWRFVPEKKDIGGGLISQKKSVFRRRPDYYNAKLLDFPFNFKHSDLEAIFVKSKKEIISIVDQFELDSEIIFISNWNNC